MKATMILSMTFVWALTASAALTKFESRQGEVHFEAVGKPSILKIKGEKAATAGKLEWDGKNITGTFDVALDDFKTGIDLRDRHMKENYLKTAQFPKATLKVESVALPENWKPGVKLNDADFKGKMTLKGVTKDVTGKVTVEGESLKTSAHMTLQLSDFEVGVPKYMGITVADSVNVKIDIPAFERK